MLAPATHVMAWGSVRLLASWSRRTPNSRATISCAKLATVMPHAPRLSCSAHSCGAMVVFPCGASSTPWEAHQSASRSALARSAPSSSVSSGVWKSARTGFPARKSRWVLPWEVGGTALCRQSSRMSARRATLPAVMAGIVVPASGVGGVTGAVPSSWNSVAYFATHVAKSMVICLTLRKMAVKTGVCPARRYPAMEACFPGLPTAATRLKGSTGRQWFQLYAWAR